MSDERHACLAALTTHAVGPDAGLGFADVGFVPHKLVKGRALVCFWPLGNMRVIKADTGMGK